MRIQGTTLIVAAMLTASCGALPGNDDSAGLGEVSTVVELKNAAVEAGYDCPNWTQSDHMPTAAQSGSCAEDDVFSVWTDQEAKQSSINFVKSVGGTTLLVGPNWMINSDDAAALAEEMGGVVVSSDP